MMILFILLYIHTSFQNNSSIYRFCKIKNIIQSITSYLIQIIQINIQSSILQQPHFRKNSIQKQMLKSFLQLNVNLQHNKSQYSIKRNKLVLLNNVNGNKQTIHSRVSPSNHRNMTQNNLLTSSKGHKQSNHTNKSSLFKEHKNQQTKLGPQQVKFDCITYDYKSTNQKLLYDFLMLKPKSPSQASSISDINFFSDYQNQPNQIQQKIPASTTSMSILFNYDIGYQKLQQFFTQMMQIKKFQQSKYKIAHFQLRNNHISDYNKTQIPQKYKQKRDQMDNFTKQIDTCIKLDKTWKIKQRINYKQFTRKDYKQKDILNRNNLTNYQKKTNQFFICEIDNLYQINVIVLHRQKDFVLTKAEDKEIDQAFILLKNSQNCASQNKTTRMNIQFTTSLVQLMQSYLIDSDQVVFVSQYPNLNNSSSLEQLLSIPIKIDQYKPEQVQKIMQTYNKQKQTKLQQQMIKMKTKLRELQYKKKNTQENIAYLMKKYKKGFENIFDSLNYLKTNNITDLGSFRANLENEIKQKQQEIKEQLDQLKQINYDMIISQERNQYFKQKMEILKENLQEDLQDTDAGFGRNTKSSTKKSSKNHTIAVASKQQPSKSPRHVKKQNVSPRNQPTDKQLTQTILKKFLQAQQQTSQSPYSIQLQREVDRYSNELRQKTRQRLIKSNQVSSFHNLMQELRKKLSKQEFTKLEQKYLGLISFC